MHYNTDKCAASTAMGYWILAVEDLKGSENMLQFYMCFVHCFSLPDDVKSGVLYSRDQSMGSGLLTVTPS